MKQYKVTLNFTFTPHGCDVEEEYDDDGNLVEMEEGEDKEKYEAFQRTDAYYQKHSVEEHVRKNDALAFVEYVVCDGEVVSAEWDRKGFAIYMVVNTEQSKKNLIRDLKMNSLEDGEYEACGDTGWIVMTRGPDGEVFNGDWDKIKQYWEYGLTDYRHNPIEVVELGEVVEMPSIQELVGITEQGRATYAKIKALKDSGAKVHFSEDDERLFKMLCTLMGDKKHYGTAALV